MHVFAGTYDEVLTVADAVLGIDRIVVEDKPASAAVIRYGSAHAIPVIKIGHGESFPDFEIAGTSLLVMASFGRLLRRSTIEAIDTIVNFHPGIIQTCRGRHPLPCAILRGDPLMGITCHQVDSEAVDAGPIVAQVQLAIDYDADYAANDARLRAALPGLARLVFTQYAQLGRCVGACWRPAPGSYLSALDESTLKHVFTVKRLRELVPEKTLHAYCH